MLRALSYFLIISFWTVGSLPALAQESTEEEEGSISVVDSLYREDQIYIGLSIHLMSNGPSDFSQSGFSGSVHFGIMRDMPVNERRNKAIGVGLGFSLNAYNYNLFVGEDPQENSIFRILDEDVINYDINRFHTTLIEMPIEYRWRTSTLSSHKFWRIYAGLRLGYALYYKATFEQPGNQVIQTDIPEYNPFRVGANITFGYNTFNFHVYYSLNNFFKPEAQINGEEIGLRVFKVGLTFYLL
ncbi:porin family protein [Croceiramulus getboli]|nr:porin family protein [Flavobacteriaceae bacterium YJPT1-3]